MLAQGRGSIMNIGSLASSTALGRGHIAYSMAMGAVAQMTRELSTEWSGRGVRVNAILPAQVLNPGLEQRMAAAPGLREKFLSGIPLSGDRSETFVISHNSVVSGRPLSGERSETSVRRHSR
mgnify:CR=1 FL=1